MLFTLKVCETAGGEDSSTTWIAGVSRVHRIGRATVGKYRDEWSSYLEMQFSDYTGTHRNSDEWVTLLCVEIPGREFQEYLAVRNAWLLAPSGDTIERIAP